jgi:hypothetical protein
MAITIEVRITKNDVRSARWAWYFRSTFGRIALLVLLFVVVLTAIQVSHGDIALAKPNFGIILFLTLLPIAVGFAGINSPAVKRFTEAPVRYTFSEQGLGVKMTRAEATFEWPEIARAIETKRYIMLIGGGALQIVPKQLLHAEEVQMIRSLAKEGLGNKARLAA